MVTSLAKSLIQGILTSSLPSTMSSEEDCTSELHFENALSEPHPTKAALAVNRRSLHRQQWQKQEKKLWHKIDPRLISCLFWVVCTYFHSSRQVSSCFAHFNPFFDNQETLVLTLECACRSIMVLLILDKGNARFQGLQTQLHLEGNQFNIALVRATIYSASTSDLLAIRFDHCRPCTSSSVAPLASFPII